MLDMNRLAIRNALEFQRVMLEYRAYGIELPMGEIRQRSAETRLTLAGAAREILQQKIREA